MSRRSLRGGGATGGSANDHDGSALAEQGDIVVVTVNYRLGALGFFNGGNHALQDVLLALQWARRSIAGLGGDPQKVTLAGESAGGTVICPLLAAPRSFPADCLMMWTPPPRPGSALKHWRATLAAMASTWVACAARRRCSWCRQAVAQRPR